MSLPNKDKTGIAKLMQARQPAVDIRSYKNTTMFQGLTKFLSLTYVSQYRTKDIILTDKKRF